MEKRYQVIGMRGAGSLIVEFMLTAVGKAYDISFPEADEMRQAAFRTLNPLGKVPVLICPDDQTICETLAITAHLFEALSWHRLLAVPPQPALAISGHASNLHLSRHHQHRTEYYAPDSAFDAVRPCRRRTGASQILLRKRFVHFFAVPRLLLLISISTCWRAGISTATVCWPNGQNWLPSWQLCGGILRLIKAGRSAN